MGGVEKGGMDGGDVSMVAVAVATPLCQGLEKCRRLCEGQAGHTYPHRWSGSLCRHRAQLPPKPRAR